MVESKLIVLTPEAVEKRRGANANEMLFCEHCEKPQVIFVCTMSVVTNVKADGRHYDRIVIERWRCLNCNASWMEKYGVESPSRGVEESLDDVIILRYRNGVENQSEGTIK